MIVKPFVRDSAPATPMKLAGAAHEEKHARLLDEQFGESPHHAVLHDLQLRISDRSWVQIDHILVNRFGEVYVIETKSAGEGFEVDTRGDWRFRYDGRAIAMRSPIEQAKRQAEALAKIARSLALPPRLRWSGGLDVRWAVAVADNTTMELPTRPSEDLSRELGRVVRASNLGDLMRRDLREVGDFQLVNSMLNWPMRLMSKAALCTLAEAIAGRHDSGAARPICGACHVTVSTAVVRYCQGNARQFDGQILCRSCQDAHRAGRFHPRNFDE